MDDRELDFESKILSIHEASFNRYNKINIHNDNI